MKALKYIALTILLAAFTVSCQDEWDDHFSAQEGEVDNENVEVVSETTIEYLKASTSFSKIAALLEKTRVYHAMDSLQSLYTVFVANNDVVEIPEDDDEYFAKGHITTARLSPSSLTDGQKIVMWNKKYVNISNQSTDGDYSQITFNGNNVKKVIKTANGYIYELGEAMNTPRSLIEVIESLGDDYSMFKEMVLSRNVTVFDKANSTPIGVDASGNTIYDSIFVRTNPYFEEKGFNLFEENMSATMLIPSDELIQNAMDEAHAKLATFNWQRQDSILENWCFQTAFFKERYERQAMEDPIVYDLYSVFDKQWRTTVNKVDLDNPVEMSNGIAYYMTELRIPQSVLIYRFKDFLKWYEFLSVDDVAKYYNYIENVRYHRLVTRVAMWPSPWPEAGWPSIENRVLESRRLDNSQPATWEFTAYSFKKNDDNTYVAAPYLIPPGEYNFCMGFHSDMTQAAEIYINGELIRTMTAAEISNAYYRHDRGAGDYPEFFDIRKATGKNAGNYDRDGGTIAVITIPGTEPVELTIRFHFYEATTATAHSIHHWCLKPTANCY